MAYGPYYYITDWENEPSQKTAINRTNLLHMENGIKEADNRIVQLDANKAEKSTINSLVKDVTLDTNSGILTVILQNGTTKTYDLDIERVVTNFDINDQNELVLTLADGTVKTIDLTRFVYSVASSSTITMTINNRVMTASIVDGSVTMDKLDAAIQTEFRQYLLDAQSARDAAKNYQLYAKRYTKGDQSFPGSETDNAEYYYGQTKTAAEESGQNATAAADSAGVAQVQAGIATQKATSATASENNASASAQIATQKATAAGTSEQVATQKAAAAGASQTAAAQSAMEASNSALLAKRYAVGGVVPEDTEDNAEHYYQEAKNYATIAQEVTDMIYPDIFINIGTGHLHAEGGNNFSVSLNDNGHLISVVGSEAA